MARPKKSDAPDAELIQRIKERVKQADAYYAEQWEQSREDTAFCDPVNQWDANDRSKRENKGIPCLVVDRMTPFIDQIANDYRMNRQGCTASPVDSQGDKKTAEVISGLIRHIEYDSKSDYAYGTSFLQTLRGGIGYFRLFLDYCNPDSFEQDIKIARIADWETVRFDPASTEPDGSDANWCAVFNDLTEDEYKEQFPGSDMAQASSGQWRNIESQGWGNTSLKTIRVCEYYERTREKRTICLLDDGSVMDLKDVPEGVAVTQKRDSYKNIIKHYVVNAVEKLAETTFPGEWMPVFPVYGQELVVDGKRMYSGLVRRLMDVQKMVNYWKSTQTWLIAIAPKAPWVGAQGFREGMEHEWANANKEAYATLEYAPVTVNGQIMPPPMRNVQEPAIGAITNALMGTEEDLKAVTGMYDPSMGRGDSSQSGVAIRNLQHQGQVGNFHFLDNANRTRGHLYRVIVDLIPLIYDTPRTLRIIGADDSQETVEVNQETGKIDPETGKPLLYDLTTGKYDVVVSVGPSYASKRQENLAVMMEMMKALGPDQQARIMDLVAGQMDTPIANEIAERLKLPEFQKQEGDGPPVPPQLQQQFQQMQQMLQQEGQMVQAMTAKIHELQDAAGDEKAKLDQEMAKAILDSETKKEIARMDNETELIKLQATLDAKKADDQIQAQLAELEATHGELQQLVLSMHDQMAKPEVEEPAEPQAAPDPGMSREDLAAHFSAQIEAMKHLGGAPVAHQVSLSRAPDGSLSGVIAPQVGGE